MMSYLSVEWRKPKIFHVDDWYFLLSFLQPDCLGIYFGAAYSMVEESEKVPVLWGTIDLLLQPAFSFRFLVSLYVAMMLGKEFDRKKY